MPHSPHSTVPDRLEGAGASRCCAILALYNAGLMALQRRCGFGPAVDSTADGGEAPASEYGSPECAARPAVAACCTLIVPPVHSHSCTRCTSTPSASRLITSVFSAAAKHPVAYAGRTSVRRVRNRLSIGMSMLDLICVQVQPDSIPDAGFGSVQRRVTSAVSRGAVHRARDAGSGLSRVSTERR